MMYVQNMQVCVMCQSLPQEKIPEIKCCTTSAQFALCVCVFDQKKV